MAKKAVVLFSGGKDSSLALFKAINDKNLKVIGLATVLPKEEDSFMFHTPYLDLLKKQAKELKLPLILEETIGKQDEELKDLAKLMKRIKKDHNAEIVVIGGISSNYQGKRIKKIAKQEGLQVYAPLWQYTSNRLWNELLKNGFQVIITKISSEGIPKNFIGKIVNSHLLEQLKLLSKKYKFSLDFEGGDAETTVLYMPGFSKSIKVNFDIISEDKYRHFLKLK